jgi:molybdate transport system substrate-binding protein
MQPIRALDRCLRILARLLCLGLGLTLLFPAQTQAKEGALTISSAISLKQALETLAEEYRRRHPKLSLRMNFGGSGQLRGQIEQGAPVDLFLAADATDIERLVSLKLVDPSSPTWIAANRLVFIVPHSLPVERRPTDVTHITQLSRIAMGQPSTVPAGRYTKEALSSLGIWSQVQKKLIYAENVRQVLDYVERGEVEGGFVYATDITLSKRAKELLPVPQKRHKAIVYGAAIPLSSSQKEAAQNFLDMLMSPEGQNVFARLGFLPPPQAPRISP